MSHDWNDLIKEKDWKYKQLLDAAEDLATALMELAPDSKFAAKVIQAFEKVRDGRTI